MSPTSKKARGFLSGDLSVLDKLRSHADSSVVRNLNPVAGTDFKTDKFVTFVLETGPSEFVSLSSMPFYMVYRLTRGEATFQSLAVLKRTVQGNADNLDATRLKEMAYINNALGCSSFFTHCEMELNDFDLTGITNLGKQQYLYAGGNMFMSRESERLSVMGSSRAQIIDTTEKRNFDTAGSDAVDPLKANLQTTEYYSAQSYKTDCFGFDGYPGIGFRNFAYCTLSGRRMQDTPPLIIPPSSRFLVKMFFTQNVYDRLEFYGGDEHYFGITNPTVILDQNETKLSIKELKLQYESHSIGNPAVLSRLLNSTYKYNFDIPRYQQFSVPVNQSFMSFQVTVPAKTNVMFITFLRTWQIYPSTVKNQSARFLFPRFLKNVNCTFPGNDTYGFSSGYTDLGRAPMNHISPRAYYETLVQKQLIDCTFEELFPPSGSADAEHYSYRQLLFLDVRNKKLARDQSVELAVQFEKSAGDAADLEKDLSILVFTIQEGQLTRHKGKKFDLVLV